METKINLMNKDEIKNFKPSVKMIKTAQDVFLNMANVETIKPIVLGIQNKILEKHQFKVKNEFKRHEKQKIVLKPSNDYLMSDADFKVYMTEQRNELKKVNLETENPEFCPLLVAEDNLRKAENKLIESFKVITGLSCSDVNMKLDTRKKFLELTLRFMSRFINY